jgi:uncharacterized membrane protein
MWDFFNTLFTGGYPLANLLVAILAVVLFTFLFRKAILVVLMKKLDIPTITELKENEFYHLHKSILLLSKALKVSAEDYKRLFDNAVEDVEKIKIVEELKP